MEALATLRLGVGPAGLFPSDDRLAAVTSAEQSACELREVRCDRSHQHDAGDLRRAADQELPDTVVALLMSVVQFAEARTRSILLLGLWRLHSLAPRDQFRRRALAP